MVKPSPSFEYLHQILEYDPDTGELRNKIDRSPGKAGHVHRAKNTGGYIVLGIKGTPYVAHRVIWFMMTGFWPDWLIDHKNGMRDDNRWENLREASPASNCANRKVSSCNRLGVKGVSQVGNRFKAFIRVDGKLVHLGYYDTAAEAASAYAIAANAIHGNFARAS